MVTGAEEGLPASHLCIEGHPCVGPPKLTKKGGFPTFPPKYREHKVLITTKFKVKKTWWGLLRKSQCIQSLSLF